MRKALIVGVDYYNHLNGLHGCVNDAHEVKSTLARHSDGSVNFGVKLLTATGPTDPLDRAELKAAIQELFSGDSEISLFYFAGHGHVEATGGYLVTSDCRSGDDGVPLNEILTLANKSAAKNKVIILDSCHSGVAGNLDADSKVAELTEGLTILTATAPDQYAEEKDGAGVFTTLFVDALRGSAANLVGDITPGSVYAHIDQSLGVWNQRPLFKTNVKTFVSLRKVQPPIPPGDIRMLPVFFPEPGFVYQLNPSYEPESDCPARENAEKFAILQKYNRVNLVVPVDAPSMYHAAIRSKACKLTVIGEHYRRLVTKELI